MAAFFSQALCNIEGYTPVKCCPGSVMERIIEVLPEIVVLSAIVRWPAKLAAPPIMQKFPILVLPEMAAQPATTQH